MKKATILSITLLTTLSLAMHASDKLSKKIEYFNKYVNFNTKRNHLRQNLPTDIQNSKSNLTKQFKLFCCSNADKIEIISKESQSLNLDPSIKQKYRKKNHFIKGNEPNRNCEIFKFSKNENLKCEIDETNSVLISEINTKDKTIFKPNFDKIEFYIKDIAISLTREKNPWKFSIIKKMQSSISNFDFDFYPYKFIKIPPLDAILYWTIKNKKIKLKKGTGIYESYYEAGKEIQKLLKEKELVEEPSWYESIFN